MKGTKQVVTKSGRAIQIVEMGVFELSSPMTLGSLIGHYHITRHHQLQRRHSVYQQLDHIQATFRTRAKQKSIGSVNGFHKQPTHPNIEQDCNNHIK